MHHLLNACRNRYQCCEGLHLLSNGSLALMHGAYFDRPPGAGSGKLLNPRNASPGWNVSRFAEASVDMYIDIVPGDTTMCDMTSCKPKPGRPANCSTPATICRAALARLPDFIEEVKQVLEVWQLKGLHFVRVLVLHTRAWSGSRPWVMTRFGWTQDWEYGCGNDIPCHEELWGAVSKAIRPLGKHLAFSIDDSRATAFDIHKTSWSYLQDWVFFKPFADALINMGTYPLAKCWHGTPPPHSITPADRVAAATLKAEPCAGLSGRWCGLEGQVLDMVTQKVEPSFQLQVGLKPDGCSGDGVDRRKQLSALIAHVCTD